MFVGGALMYICVPDYPFTKEEEEAKEGTHDHQRETVWREIQMGSFQRR